MQNTTSQILYKYWNEIRGTRMAPRRFEIEPARFAGILPETFVVECEPGEGHRFRLAGTRVTEKLGFELRGREFRDLFDGDETHDFKPFLDSIMEKGAVGVITVDMPTASKRSARFEIIVLPLIHTEDRITRLLGAISTCNHEPWLGSEPLLPGRVVEKGIIWPDGRPHAVAERMVQPSPFKQDFTLSRIVRSRRRLFRVYDGGR
jgi:hypothetical protein